MNKKHKIIITEINIFLLIMVLFMPIRQKITL